MESSWQSIWKGNLLKWQSPLHPLQKAPWRGQAAEPTQAPISLSPWLFWGGSMSKGHISPCPNRTDPPHHAAERPILQKRCAPAGKVLQRWVFQGLELCWRTAKKKTRPIPLRESDGCLQSEATSPQAGANPSLRSAPCTHPTPSSTLRARRREPYPAAFVFLPFFSPCG